MGCKERLRCEKCKQMFDLCEIVVIYIKGKQHGYCSDCANKYLASLHEDEKDKAMFGD